MVSQVRPKVVNNSNKILGYEIVMLSPPALNSGLGFSLESNINLLKNGNILGKIATIKAFKGLWVSTINLAVTGIFKLFGSLAFKWASIGAFIFGLIFDAEKIIANVFDFGSTTVFGGIYDFLLIIQTGLIIFGTILGIINTANEIYELKPIKKLGKIAEKLENFIISRNLPYLIIAFYAAELFFGYFHIIEL